MQLLYTLFAYRMAVHEATRETPFFLLYGRDPQLPADSFLKGWVEKASNPEALSEEVAIKFKNARKRLKKTVQGYKDRMKERNNKRIKPDLFKEGDRVWLDKLNKRKGESQKFKALWIGPYRIVKRRDNTAKIENTCNTKKASKKQQKYPVKEVRNPGKDIYAQERKRGRKRKWAEDEEYEVEKITEERYLKGEAILYQMG